MEIPREGGGPACDRGEHILTAVGKMDARNGCMLLGC